MLKKWFAYLLNKGERFDRKLSPYREKLFSDVKDKTILEIGAGAGLNLRYYKGARKIYLLEPNQYAHKYIFERMRKFGMDASVLNSKAESISLANQSVDIVVATFVLCSVQNINTILLEIHRVLKPLGKFILLEHIAAESGWLNLFQRILRSLWRKIADGCDCHRDTQSILESFGSFQPVDVKVRYDVPFVFLRPWLLGIWQRK